LNFGFNFKYGFGGKKPGGGGGGPTGVGVTLDPSNKSTGIALSGGNLIADCTSGGWRSAIVTGHIAITNGGGVGKYYWEVHADSGTTSVANMIAGLINLDAAYSVDTYFGASGNFSGGMQPGAGSMLTYNSTPFSLIRDPEPVDSLNVGGGEWTSIAYDQATGKIWYGVNGTWGNSGDPSAGSLHNVLASGSFSVGFGLSLNNSGTGPFPVAFATTDFRGTPPSGFTPIQEA